MFSLQLVYRGYPPQKRLWNAAVARVFERVGHEWHQQYYEHHFTHEGAAEYGYYKRKGELLPRDSKQYRRSYTGRKERKFGHTLPLRFTSTAYNIGKLAIVRATSKWGKVVLPSVFNYQHEKTRIVMRDEITKVMPSEADHLRAIGDREMAQQLNAIRNT